MWAMIADFGFRRQAKVIFEHLKIQIYTGYQELTLIISQLSVTPRYEGLNGTPKDLLDFVFMVHSLPEWPFKSSLTNLAREWENKSKETPSKQTNKNT